MAEFQRLHQAVSSPTAGTHELQELLRSGAVSTVDASDPAGYTCLMLAIKSGKGDRALLLLQAGADCTLVNASGWSSFHWAASTNDVRVLTSLVQRACVASPKALRAALAAQIGELAPRGKHCRT